jgi:hypothetical protein
MILGELLIIVQPKMVVETGTFHGCTTKFVCEFMKRNGLPECHMAAFDLPQVIQEIQSCDPYFASQDNVELVGGLLPASLKRYLETSGQKVDLAIVDSDHSYNAVLSDLETLAPHMKPGSYIFAHDYRKCDPEYVGLVAAVNHFAVMHGFAMLPLNSSNLERREVWGSALLRTPDEDALPISSEIYYRTLGKVITHIKHKLLAFLHR